MCWTVEFDSNICNVVCVDTVGDPESGVCFFFVLTETIFAPHPMLNSLLLFPLFHFLVSTAQEMVPDRMAHHAECPPASSTSLTRVYFS